MKKLILKIALGITFITFVAINMVKGQDQISFPGGGGGGGTINPECPNGCQLDGTGCFCNKWYYNLKEAE